MHRIYIALIAVSSFYLHSCSSGRAKETNTKPDVQAPAPAYELVKVTAGQPDFLVTLPGELLPYEQVEVFAKVRGFVKKIHVNRGSLVRKGQLLAELEAPELADMYASKRAGTQAAYEKYLFSKQSFDRLQKSSEKPGAVAAIELEKAYAQLLADSTAYESRKAESAASGHFARYLLIRAPFSGTITARNVSEGALTGDAAGLPMFSLAQTNKLRLTVAIPEKHKNALQPETRATFTVIDIPGQTFTAEFSRSSDRVDASLRSVVAEFDVDNQDRTLAAGQYARVKLNLKRKAASLWVPKSSVVAGETGSFVVKSTRGTGTALRIPVITGMIHQDKVEVFGDLIEGDEVVLRGSEEIVEGTELLLAGQ